MLKIYGDRRSGNCLKVLYAVTNLGLDHTWVEVDILAGQTRSEAFVRLNPAGQIPVVEFHDGRCLAQSNAILLYLARDSQLIPGDPWRKAKMMEWLFWEQYSHEPAIAVCRFQMLYLGLATEELDPEKVKKGDQALDLMDGHLEFSEWMVEGGFSLADISLVAYTRLAQEGGFELSTRPAVQRWIASVEGVLGI